MGFWSVIGAGVLAWVLGLLWYRAFGARRRALIGQSLSGQRGGWPLALAGLLLLILVAGFLRHIYHVSGLTQGLPLGIVAGLGVGLFFIAPWLGLLNWTERRPFRLTLIDGGYACLATAVIGGGLIAL